MLDSRDLLEDDETLRRQRLEQARGECDLAYFQARLAFIGEPATLNQAAQRKVFRVLHRLIASRLPDAGSAAMPSPVARDRTEIVLPQLPHPRARAP